MKTKVNLNFENNPDIECFIGLVTFLVNHLTSIDAVNNSMMHGRTAWRMLNISFTLSGGRIYAKNTLTNRTFITIAN